MMRDSLIDVFETRLVAAIGPGGSGIVVELRCDHRGLVLCYQGARAPRTWTKTG